jgi:hypothetical protein
MKSSYFLGWSRIFKLTVVSISELASIFEMYPFVGGIANRGHLERKKGNYYKS